MSAAGRTTAARDATIGFVGLGHMGGNMAARRFDLAFMHKDIELALGAAREVQAPLPTAERADEVIERAVAMGHERRDLAYLFQVLEQISDGDRARA